MTTMQERIDTLIKMRKEKPEHHWEWNKLRNALVQEDGLLTADETAHLNTAFKNIQQEEQLKLWDDRFHEVLITGTFTDEYEVRLDNSFGSAPRKAEGSRVTLGGNVGTASWTSAVSTEAKQIIKDEMVKAYKDYQWVDKNDKQAY